MKKWLIIFLILIIIFGLIGCVTIDDENNDNKNEEYSKLTYRIEILGSNRSEPFTLNVPIIINNSGNILEINNGLKIIKGNPEFEFENTIYGNSLRIISNKSCSLEVQRDYKNLNEITTDFALLSLETNSSSFEYWIYLNYSSNENITLKLFYEIVVYKNNEITGTSTIELIKNLKINWNKYEGEMSSIID